MSFELKSLVYTSLFTTILLGGCSSHHNDMHAHEKVMSRISTGNQPSESEKRVSLGLSPTALNAHQAVMQDHLKAIHEIIAALAEEDFLGAKDVTETRLGFAKHREAMRLQNPENFPPGYHDLAMDHHQAAEDLAKAIPSKNLKQILPYLERTLGTCVQCHEKYTR